MRGRRDRERFGRADRRPEGALRFGGHGVYPVEIRVRGALARRRGPRPTHTRLTLNALRLACTPVDEPRPVTELDDAAIRAALERLSRRR